MARAKRGFKARRRRKKILKEAKGNTAARSNRIRMAAETVRRGLRYATRHRKERKRDFRGLWIIRIGNAARDHGMSYSQLMGRLAKAEVKVNRKMLSELAIHNPKGFAALVESIR